MKNDNDYIVDGKTNRPATLEDVKTVVKLLDDNNVPYLLIGGYAMMLQGNQRTTEDIDIVFPMGPETGALIKKALSNLPDNAAAKIDNQWFSDDQTIRVADEFTVDLLFKCGGGKYKYNDLVKYSEIRDLNGLSVKTINAEGLWYTKQTGRAKDIPDLLFLNELLKIQGIEVNSDLQENYSFEAVKTKIIKLFKR